MRVQPGAQAVDDDDGQESFFFFFKKLKLRERERQGHLLTITPSSSSIKSAPCTRPSPPPTHQPCPGWAGIVTALSRCALTSRSTLLVTQVYLRHGLHLTHGSGLEVQRHFPQLQGLQVFEQVHVWWSASSRIAIAVGECLGA